MKLTGRRSEFGFAHALILGVLSFSIIGASVSAFAAPSGPSCGKLLLDANDQADLPANVLLENRRVAVLSAANSLSLLYPSSNTKFVFFPGVADPLYLTLSKVLANSEQRVFLVAPKEEGEGWSDYVDRFRKQVGANSGRTDVVVIVPDKDGFYEAYANDVILVARMTQSMKIYLHTVGRTTGSTPGLYAFAKTPGALKMSYEGPAAPLFIQRLQRDTEQARNFVKHASLERIESQGRQFIAGVERVAGGDFKGNGHMNFINGLMLMNYVEATKQSPVELTLYPESEIKRWLGSFIHDVPRPSSKLWTKASENRNRAAPKKVDGTPPALKAPSPSSDISGSYGGDYAFYDPTEVHRTSSDPTKHIYGGDDHEMAAFYGGGSYVHIPETKEARTKRLAREAEKKIEDAKKKEADRLEAQRMLKEFKIEVREPGERGDLLRDVVVADWLANDRPSRVTILVGNAFEELSKQKTVLLTDVVAGLVKKGRTIIFDADATTAPLIAGIAGKFGLAIGSRPRDLGEAQSFVIENAYLRLRAFQHARDIVVDGSSLSGRGVMVEKPIDVVLESPSWAGNLSNWTEKIITQFGWSSNGLYYDKYMTDAKRIVDKLGLFRAEAPKRFNLDGCLEGLSAQSMTEFRAYADEMIAGRRLLEKDEAGAAATAGAVMFGSGKFKPDYSDLVYQSARYLAEAGVPVATGGSGGYMEVANAGAYGAGGVSIGIPVKSLKSETRVPTEVQTQTIRSSHYSTRIPLLMYRRPLIIFAPGGAGTAKELGVALVELSGANNREHLPKLVFLSRDYYGRWPSMLKDLPSAIQDRFAVVDSPKELAGVLKGLLEDPRTDASLLTSGVRPVPRNNETKFKEPDPKDQKSSKDDSDAE